MLNCKFVKLFQDSRRFDVKVKIRIWVMFDLTLGRHVSFNITITENSDLILTL